MIVNIAQNDRRGPPETQMIRFHHRSQDNCDTGSLKVCLCLTCTFASILYLLALVVIFILEDGGTHTRDPSDMLEMSEMLEMSSSSN